MSGEYEYPRDHLRAYVAAVVRWTHSDRALTYNMIKEDWADVVPPDVELVPRFMTAHAFILQTKYGRFTYNPRENYVVSPTKGRVDGLPHTERRLLTALLVAAPDVVDHQTLFNYTWGYPTQQKLELEDEHLLNVYIHRTRYRIGDVQKDNFIFIETVKFIGYKFNGTLLQAENP